MENPFIIRGYGGPDLFCDREFELETLMQNVRNHVDTTMISHRRMGKTGLILRLFDELKSQGVDVTPIYVDIYASQNLADLIRMISEAVMRSYPKRTTFGEKFWEFITSFRPTVSFDPLSGNPKIGFSYRSESDKEQTLQAIFQFLESRERRVILAIDEFQEIRKYPEKSTEAMLRTHMQAMRNVNFIFCGSKKHMMVDMFANAGNPFYASTTFMSLSPISAEAYTGFITRLFEQAGRTITPEAVRFILDWTRRHTFYTQSVCHAVFASGCRSVTLRDVERECGKILDANSDIYLQYRQLLTPAQWNFLIAVAKENGVTQATSSRFLEKYSIGAPSSARRLLDSLIEKEMIITDVTPDTTSYTLYDVFMMRYLATLDR